MSLSGFRITTLGLLAVICACFQMQASFASSITLDDANAAFAVGDFQSSIRYCNFLLATRPTPMVHFCRAKALVQFGSLEEAKHEYQIIVGSTAEDDKLKLSSEAALAMFDTADGTPLSHYKLANALVKIGEGDEAKSEYEWVLRNAKDPILQKYCRAALAAFGSAEVPTIKRSASSNRIIAVKILAKPVAK